MRNLNEVKATRLKGHPANIGNSPTCGMFKVQTRDRAFFVMASIDRQGDGSPVDHISISHRNENIYPTWDEMCYIKDLFFFPEENAVQFFPKKSEYVNLVKNCFHLWRPHNGVLLMNEGERTVA